MATNTAQILENKKEEVNREEIKAAIAKAVELRALHASLMQSNTSPSSNLRFSSPVSHYSAHDYPVFTPSYEGEPLSGYQQLQLESQGSSEYWDDYWGRINASSRIGVSSDLIPNSEQPHICPIEEEEEEDQNYSVAGSSAHHKSSRRRSSLGDLNSISSCNRCKPAVISTTGLENGHPKNTKYSNIVVPLTDSHSSVQSQAKGRGLSSFSWLFTRLKKKKNENSSSPNRTEPTEEGSSQVLKDFGIMSAEALKRELVVASESRDAALIEAAEMKSSVGELKMRMEYLESYCEELKKALKQSTVVAKESKESQFLEKQGIKQSAHVKESKESQFLEKQGNFPVSEEVMVEGFLQIVSEARLSVKQFCKTLISQIEESDNTLVENLNNLLQPYKLSLNSKYSKVVLYHLEAVINQSLYLDFENCVFQKNGSPKILDPQQDRQAQFSSFVSLRNLSWNEVLRKGTRYYSEEFSKFCDQKMSYIITTLNWTRPWPEQLLQAFFVAAKCIWLLHLLAFSFNPPLGILRVEENRGFDSHYMEDILMDRQRSQSPSKVKIMVLPGFYVQDRILRCKVLCKYKSVA